MKHLLENTLIIASIKTLICVRSLDVLKSPSVRVITTRPPVRDSRSQFYSGNAIQGARCTVRKLNSSTENYRIITISTWPYYWGLLRWHASTSTCKGYFNARIHYQEDPQTRSITPKGASLSRSGTALISDYITRRT
jgi:hypothetical protein